MNKIYERKKLYRKKRKQEVVNYLGGSCQSCGYNKSMRCLSFHHIDRLTKEYGITDILDYSWKTVVKELDKCELLCLNCHMEKEEEYEKNKIWLDWEYCF